LVSDINFYILTACFWVYVIVYYWHFKNLDKGLGYLNDRIGYLNDRLLQIDQRLRSISKIPTTRIEPNKIEEKESEKIKKLKNEIERLKKLLKSKGIEELGDVL